MLNHLSDYIVDFLLRKKVISQENREIYIYGYQIIISSVSGVIIIIIIGTMLKCLFESFIFLGVFILTRQCSGGYHAKTFLKCCLLFVSSYLAILVLEQFMIDKITIYHIICLMLVYIFTILKYAPIENKNKKLLDKNKALNRKKSIVISLFWLFVVIELYPLSHKLSLLIVLTLILVTVYILIAEFRREVGKHEKGAYTYKDC
jgi:Membrane protein putatively involved in post-translational modification of the autoinducing quorum-sensing peptide